MTHVWVGISGDEDLLWSWVVGQPLRRRPGWKKKLVMQSRDRVRSAEETACVDASRLQRSCEEWGECTHVAGKAGSL